MKKIRSRPFILLNLIIISIAISLSSCSKHELSTDSISDHSTVPIFKSGISLMDYSKAIFSLSYEERIAWEDSHGYRSFGSICEELYLSIDPADFKSIQEVKQFVSKHSKYLQLIEDEDGRLTLEVVDYKNPYRYMMNKDKMFQIDNSAYKISGDYILSTDVGNIEKLRTQDAQNLDFSNKDGIKVWKYNNNLENNRLKDATYNYGTSLDPPAKETNGNYRTKVELDEYMWDNYGTMIYTHYLVRAYKYVWPVWYWNTRDLTVEVKVAEDYYISPTWDRFIMEDAHTDSKTGNNLSTNVGEYIVSAPGSVPHIHHWGGYFIKATSDKTDDVVAQENAGYFW
ncbi:MAG: hypothetical protein U9N86_15375 [Bacteroidota bacterium]|nr:hypothetical protein [Bacteroidota bacterium]